MGGVKKNEYTHQKKKVATGVALICDLGHGISRN